jgi:hypothetical protein
MNQKKNKKLNKKRKVPMRTCIFCRKKQPKKDMIRLVLNQEDKPIVDTSGKQSGRGANLCANIDCFQGALSNKSFGRAWRTNIAHEDLSSLKKDFQKEIDRRRFRKDKDSVVIRVKNKDLKKKTGKDMVKSKTKINKSGN